PLVAITGQVPTALIGTDAFQEVDTFGLTIPIAKHGFLVRSAAELLDAVPRAFAIASSGRPGPVVIDVPKDVQTEVIDVESWPEPGAPAPLPPLDERALDLAASMIDGARRPILYLGGGVVASGAAAQAVALAERIGAPTVMTLIALGAMPARHPPSLGMLGMHGARCTHMARDECDLLIAAGARFDDRATGKTDAFCPEAKVIHIDIDRAELGKIRTPHVGIQADVGYALPALSARIAHRERADWRRRVDALKKRHPLKTPGRDDVRQPYGLIAAAAECIGRDAIVTTDVGQHQMWVA